MLRKARVYNKERFCGWLTQDKAKYCFRYADEYLADKNNRAISLTLPLDQKEFCSKDLFPFFFGLLSEGIAKTIQCQYLKIDENDHFGRLIKTAGEDTIGCVRVVEEKQ